MSLSWTVVGVFIFIYCYYWFWRPNNSPPGPRGFPIMGVIPFLGKYLERTIYKWSKVYGPIMTVRIGTEDQVLLNNYEIIMQALVKQSTYFSGRPCMKFMEQFSKGHGLNFIDYGNKWISQRKFGSMYHREYGVGKSNMETRIVEEVAYVNEFIRSENERAFDISSLLRNAIANNICSFTMGRRFEYDDARFQEIMRKLFGTFSDSIANAIFRLLMVAPILKHIPPFSSYNKLFMKNYNALMELLDEIVKEHEDTFDSNELRDFIDAFIKEMKKKEDPYFTNDQLIHFVREHFMAGTDTTSSTLNWCLLCCLHYPQAQTKLREEIIQVFGADGAISFSEKSKMPYVNAFIQEVYRYRTIVPLSLPHKATSDVEIGGYFIAKGTTVLPNIWAVHNDPELWDEPNKFKPERFLDEKGNFIPSKHVIPFSVGPRHCLGEQLARMEIFIFLVGMIQRFEFLPDPSADQLPDIGDGANGLTFSAVPYKIVARQL